MAAKKQRRLNFLESTGLDTDYCSCNQQYPQMKQSDKNMSGNALGYAFSWGPQTSSDFKRFLFDHNQPTHLTQPLSRTIFDTKMQRTSPLLSRLPHDLEAITNSLSLSFRVVSHSRCACKTGRVCWSCYPPICVRVHSQHKIVELRR